MSVRLKSFVCFFGGGRRYDCVSCCSFVAACFVFDGVVVKVCQAGGQAGGQAGRRAGVGGFRGSVW